MLWTPNANDWSVFDLTETVSLVRVDPADSTTTYSGILAVADAVVAAQPTDVGGMQMTPLTVTWKLRTADLPTSVRISRGDRIISTSDDYAGTWVIKGGDAIRDRMATVCRDCQLLDDPPA